MFSRARNRRVGQWLEHIGGGPKAVVALICCLVFAGFYLLVHKYSSTEEKILANEAVFQVADLAGYDARVAFGKSPLCGQDAHECWLDPSYAASQWSDMTRGAEAVFQLRQQPDYQRGLDEGWVYYRFVVPIPETLKERSVPVAFSPRAINHRDYWAYVNGQMVYRGEGITHTGAAASIVLPRSAVEAGSAVVVIKATLEPSDVGIRSFLPQLVGSAHELSQLGLAIERSMVTYFLLFLLTKGGVFLFFAMIYLLVERNREVEAFLIFAFCSALGHLLTSTLLVEVMPFNVQAVLFFGLRGAEAAALLYFFVTRFPHPPALRRRAFVSLAILAVALFPALDFAWGLHRFTIAQLYSVSHGLYWGVVALGAVLGVRYCYADMRRQGGALRNSNWLTGFLCLYLIFLSWDFFVAQFEGFEKKAVFDLLFFFAVAAEVGAGFAGKERLLRKKEAELATVRVDQAVASAVRTLAHDVRTPLATTQMVVDMLMRQNDPETFHAFRDRMIPRLRQSIKNVDGMIDDILAASSESALQLKTLSLAKLLEETLAEALWPKPDADVTIDCDLGHSGMVAVDAHKVKRAIANVIGNAIDATGKAGHIWIRTRERFDQKKPVVQITIGNSGSYIAPEIANKIFEAFYTKGKARGTGLGLAIAFKVVNQHGGQIWCTSDKEHGTEFHMTLPLRDDPDLHVDVKFPAHSQHFQRFVSV